MSAMSTDEAFVTAEVEHAIRKDERLRLAELFEDNEETIAGFVNGGDPRLVKLLAFMLRLDDYERIPERHTWGGGEIELSETHGAIWSVRCYGCNWKSIAPIHEAVRQAWQHQRANDAIVFGPSPSEASDG